jgi:hypothetical protein
MKKPSLFKVQKLFSASSDKKCGTIFKVAPAIKSPPPLPPKWYFSNSSLPLATGLQAQNWLQNVSTRYLASTDTPSAARASPLKEGTRREKWSAYLQINRTKINILNINVLQINGSLHQEKFVEI